MLKYFFFIVYVYLNIYIYILLIVNFYYYYMFDLYILEETFYNGYKLEFLDFFYYSSIISGIFVIISRNPIISILFLIALFLSISSYLIIIGLNFLGISYLLVYIGAVTILFLFILMLINIRVSELTSDTYNSIPLAIVIGILFLYPLYEILPNYKTYIYNDNDTINMVTSYTWDSNIIEYSHINSIGNVIYTNYFIWLIITSLILLLAMIGALCLVIN